MLIALPFIALLILSEQREIFLTCALDQAMLADPTENAGALLQLFSRDDEVTTEESWFILKQQFEFNFPEF